MQAFNLTRLNFHSPYKVWVDNGSYKFFLPDGLTNSINETVFASKFLFLEMKKLTIT